MVRQAYRTNPAQKHLEVFQNFSGGLNSVSDRAVLSDHELSDLDNMDINARGTLSRRKGMKKHISGVGTGKAQGYFQLYLDEGEVQEIVAKGGKLYKNGTPLDIEGLSSFQTERMIEAVQYRKSLYIATGTNLVEYDGEIAKVVEPYAPDPLEALYVGTNGLAEDPDNYMSDGVADFLRLDGLTFNNRYGTINEPVTMTGYVSKPSGTTIEFQFQKRLETDMSGEWDTFRDWSTTRKASFTTEEVGSYQFRVYARVRGSNDDPAEYVVPRYAVKPAPDEDDETVPTNHIYDCNRIMLYWDRLIMYGDATEPDAIFISHLNNPAYFPVTNSLRFENEEQEGITTLQRYRDMLVAFTPNSIQALYGKSPLDFSRVVFQTGIGCIAPNGTAVISNHVAFLAKDGVHVLKSTGYTENRANVEKIDTNVDDLVSRSKDVSLVNVDNQLHVVIPALNRRMRYYYNMNRVWTKDTSDKFDFVNAYEFNGDFYGLRENGDVLVPSTGYNDDGHVYNDLLETKDFTFGQPNHIKKLKELQMSLIGTGEIYVTAYADDNIIHNPTTGKAVVNADNEVEWVETYKNTFERISTTFGTWKMGISSFGAPDRIGKLDLSGKCRRTRMIVQHIGEEPNEVVGLAYVFKLKKG